MSEAEAAFRSHHDMGGEAAGKVELGEHDYAFWEKRVDALMALLSNPKRGMIRVDELRRAIEALPPDAYDRLSYYERWMSAIHRLLTEKGVLKQAEIDQRIAALKASGVGRP